VTLNVEEVLQQDINARIRKIKLKQDIGLVELIDMLIFGVVKHIQDIGSTKALY
jgi:hypothetical protein